MELYVKQLAWYSTPDKGSKLERGKKVEEVIYPDISPFEYLVDVFFSVGPLDVDWSEIKSWIEVNGIDLDYWESNTIVIMSNLLGSYLKQFDGQNIPKPFEDPDVEVDPAALAKKIQNILRAPLGRKRIK